MFEELTAGQYFDWEHYHNQFNLCADKIDRFWAFLLSMFQNANCEEGSEMKPIEFLPWIDPYGDDEAFLASIRGFAATVQQQESPGAPSQSSAS